MPFDAVIFDIDNVLIDTRASYTDCIRDTVETYLVTHFKFQPARSRLLSRGDIEMFKSLGGFNDDWDTSYGLLLYLLTLKPKRKTINELGKKVNISKFVKSVKARPSSVKKIESLLGTQDTVTFEVIESIFQSLYLQTYVWNEKLILPPALFQSLGRAKIKMGIVTGRNQEEAQFALKRFQIDKWIQKVITIDETPASKKKPDPYGLFQVAKTFGSKLRYLYVGDLPDDMLSAKRAQKKVNIKGCGYVGVCEQPQDMKRALKKAGATYLCASPAELKKLILNN